jgi:hypothetical protein
LERNAVEIAEDARGRIAALEEKAQRCEDEIAVLQVTFTRLSAGFGRLAGDVTALRFAAAGMQSLSGDVAAVKAQIAARLPNPVV